MKFLITNNMKKFFYVTFLLILIFQNHDLYGNNNNLNTKINNIIEIIKNNEPSMKSKIMNITIDIFDYENLFLSSIKDLWLQLDKNEKIKLIKFYNENFINQYLQDIISCKGIESRVIDQGSSILCEYECRNSRSNKREQIRFIKSRDTNKIADIRFRGVSFLKNEGDSIHLKYQNKDKNYLISSLR